MDIFDLTSRDLSSLTTKEYEQLVWQLERSRTSLRARGYIVLPPTTQTADATLKLTRSEVGSGPRALIDVLGLRESVVGFLIESAVPLCSACGCDACPPRSLESCELPTDGVLAVAVIDPQPTHPLAERVALLGVERACVDGYLRAASDLGAQEGEPVLCAAAAEDLSTLRETIGHWFARAGTSGGELRVLHFESRNSLAREVVRLSCLWTCPHCVASFHSLSRDAMRDAAACGRCRSAGWLLTKSEVDGQRWEACPDCNGLGCEAPGAEYRFHGVPLAEVLGVSFEFIARALERQSTDQQRLLYLVSEVCRAGLGACPIGMVYDFCSPGERIRVTLAQLYLARVQGARCLVDGAYGDFTAEDRAESDTGALSLSVVSPETCAVSQEAASSPPRAQQIVVRDLKYGVLNVDQINIPCAALTAVVGPPGIGKTLLLRILERRFSKRRVSAHNASFGDLRNCWYIQAVDDQQSALCCTLGVAGDIAAEVSRTRRAKEIGLLREDLELPDSKYSCEECHGGRIDMQSQVCPSCLDARYDWRVADLPVFGKSVAEVMRTPFEELARMPWAQSGLEQVFRELERIARQELTLGMSSEALNPALRRVLTVAAMLLRVLYGATGQQRSSRSSGDLSGELVLIDGPAVMPVQHQEIIGGLLHDVTSRGATVVYAGVPVGLESCCQSVIRLGWLPENGGALRYGSERFLDRRFSRRSSVQ